jgi:putative transposase
VGAADEEKSLDALLPILYLRGVSTGDFQEVLTALLGKDAPNLSPAVIARLTAEWQADYDAWQKRDLSARRYVYVWADGVYLQARMEEAAECMLVLIGPTPEGKKELVGFQTGVRESAQSRRELLLDIKRRGLEIAPDLAVGDGALGFWKAIEEVFPATRHQRCWVHKTANVLNKVALSVQLNMKADLREIYGAPTRAAAEAAIDVFADKYGAKYDKAVACLTKDREALLAFFDFPAEHWDHLRTSNPIESVFATVRHRTCGQREPCRQRPPYSHCWTVSGKGDPVLFRANLMQLGVSFTGHLDANLEFRFGPILASRCRLQDIGDMERLRVREARGPVKENGVARRP